VAARARTETPAAVRHDEVDFANGVDNPIEAILMPMADPVAAMVATNQFGSNATVQVAVGDQRINYTLSQPVADEFSVPGEINGEPFELNGGIDAETLQVYMAGRAPRDGYFATLIVGAGQFETEGKVGKVAFRQKTALDDMGNGVDIEGKVAGEDYRLWIGADDHGNTVGEGNLGNRPIRLRIEQGPNGSIVVHQQIGEVSVRELISPT
jgi:hypothetical protein